MKILVHQWITDISKYIIFFGGVGTSTGDYICAQCIHTWTHKLSLYFRLQIALLVCNGYYIFLVDNLCMCMCIGILILITGSGRVLNIVWSR